jgi:hypothetical protein
LCRHCALAPLRSVQAPQTERTCPRRVQTARTAAHTCPPHPPPGVLTNEARKGVYHQGGAHHQQQVTGGEVILLGRGGGGWKGGAADGGISASQACLSDAHKRAWRGGEGVGGLGRARVRRVKAGNHTTKQDVSLQSGAAAAWLVTGVTPLTVTASQRNQEVASQLIKTGESWRARKS